MSESARPFDVEIPDPDDTRGSRLDVWWANMLRTPARLRAWYWGGPIAVTLLAAVLRLWNLGNPQSLVFDETYYVKDAYSLGQYGYEGTWASEANQQFEAGDASALSTLAEYVVHPPLGKWMISLGMQWFGIGDAFAWRLTTALAGIVAVWVIMMIARRLTQSTLLAVIAGLLMAVEGTAIVMSRVAILDNWVMLFTLLGVGAVVIDRGQHERRLLAKLDAARAAEKSPTWGPASWWRPWVIVAGVAFGAACAVKWSGLWFVAGFGIYLVAVDMFARRKAGLQFWLSAGILKQGPITALLLLVPAANVYLASWTGWIVTAGGWSRDWATKQGYTGPLPDWLVSLWHYHQEAYGYHVSLSSPHPYQANPLTWLFMIRPTSMYYEGSKLGDQGCLVDSCSAAINDLGNPLMWWAATIAALYLYYRLIMRREWQVGLILTGLAVGYLPWLFYLNRTVFQFYSIAFLPYLILALTWCLGLILGKPTDPWYRRDRGIMTVVAFVGLVVIVSAFFYPIWSAMQVPFAFWNAHMWLPSWR